LLLAGGLRLLLRQGIAGLAVHGVESHNILAAQAGNGAGKHGFAANAKAEFASHIGGEPLIRLASHKAQGLLHTSRRDDLKKWRLLQIDGQRLLQRSIKYCVAGGVGEIGENERVFRGERMRGSGTEVKRSGYGENEHQCCCCKDWQARPFGGSGCCR
jgi:hypothetical protein